jgi:hypothetical protein
MVADGAVGAARGKQLPRVLRPPAGWHPGGLPWSMNSASSPARCKAPHATPPHPTPPFPAPARPQVALYVGRALNGAAGGLLMTVFVGAVEVSSK